MSSKCILYVDIISTGNSTWSRTTILYILIYIYTHTHTHKPFLSRHIVAWIRATSKYICIPIASVQVDPTAQKKTQLVVSLHDFLNPWWYFELRSYEAPHLIIFSLNKIWTEMCIDMIELRFTLHQCTRVYISITSATFHYHLISLSSVRITVTFIAYLEW